MFSGAEGCRWAGESTGIHWSCGVELGRRTTYGGSAADARVADGRASPRASIGPVGSNLDAEQHTVVRQPNWKLIGEVPLDLAQLHGSLSDAT